MKLLLLSVFAGLAACGPTYTCGDFPDAVCQSVSETYDQTRGDAGQDSHAVSTPDPPDHVILTTPDMASSPKDAGLGEPFLTRPRLLRILLTPWEDKQKDLHAGGYVYIRLEESQWVIPR
ncbi:MAG: TraV family lipoprotein [Nitrospira sp.]|nr:TraV family lipoprotein [Nitrospira sp.]